MRNGCAACVGGVVRDLAPAVGERRGHRLERSDVLIASHLHQQVGETIGRIMLLPIFRHRPALSAPG
ncbi:MAG: hypothetical protein R3349_12365 [Geminicoccaceae bacterium]|nr:hypothetical protein [Geminicoccaceae bacterium]